MSKDGSPNTRGSVPADSLYRWTVVPAGDGSSLVLEVLQRLAGHPSHGRVDAHDLFDGLAAEVRPLREQAPLVRVLHEGLHGQPELVSRGVEATEDQQHQCVPQLLVAQAVGVSVALTRALTKSSSITLSALGDQGVA